MSASTDVESQSRSRGRRLDAFLIGSVIALFLMFAVALAGALWFAKHIENEINVRKTRESESEASTGPRNMHFSDTGDAYKMQNFAYLRAIKSELKSENMAWEGVAYGNSHTIGSFYSYDKSQKALDVKNSGSYFVYVQLSLFCDGICSPGKFTVSFYNRLNSKELSCTVSLPEGTKPEPISKTCWHVVTFLENGNRLMAKSEVQGSLGDWSLLVNDSGFGMFLVDGVQAEQRT